MIYKLILNKILNTNKPKFEIEFIIKNICYEFILILILLKLF